MPKTVNVGRLWVFGERQKILASGTVFQTARAGLESGLQLLLFLTLALDRLPQPAKSKRLTCYGNGKGTRGQRNENHDSSSLTLSGFSGVDIPLPPYSLALPFSCPVAFLRLLRASSDHCGVGAGKEHHRDAKDIWRHSRHPITPSSPSSSSLDEEEIVPLLSIGSDRRCPLSRGREKYRVRVGSLRRPPGFV